MKRIYTLAGIVLAAVSVAALSARATIIQLELYNSYALVNSDGLTPLAPGDLVQVIATGPGDAISAPNAVSGAPSGQNSILFTPNLQVGEGVPGPDNAGLLDVWPLDYTNTQASSDFYVRFWNGTTVADSTYYGNSSIYELPAGDAFNQATVDFVPTSGSPRTTDQPFSLSVVPEPSSLFLFGLAVFGVWMWKKRGQLDLVDPV
jgi:PEP-CTERM motif-containing protein